MKYFGSIIFGVGENSHSFCRKKRHKFNTLIQLKLRHNNRKECKRQIFSHMKTIPDYCFLSNRG